MALGLLADTLWTFPDLLDLLFGVKNIGLGVLAAHSLVEGFVQAVTCISSHVHSPVYHWCLSFVFSALQELSFLTCL